MKIFKDRKSAGKLLARHLKKYKGKKNTIVLGIPRGGVVVAAEIAKNLNLPLDIIVTRKIGAPSQSELALGAVDADGEVVWEEKLLSDLGLKIKDLKNKVEQEVEEIRRRETAYRFARRPLARLVEGKKVILVDDGIATGSTTLAGVKYLNRHQVEKVVLAVPVASKEAHERLLEEVDKLIVLETPEFFQAVGQFYHQFEPVTDEEVIHLLNLCI